MKACSRVEQTPAETDSQLDGKLMAEDRVFVTRRHIIPDAIAFLERHFDVDVWESRNAPSKEVLRQKATECHGFLTEITDVVDADENGLTFTKAASAVAAGAP